MAWNLDTEKTPVKEAWAVRLEEPENGTVSLYACHDGIGSAITVSIRETDKPAGVIPVDPEGNEYYFPAAAEKDGNGVPPVID